MKEKSNTGYSFKGISLSFIYAFNGLKVLFREERNARIHLGVSVLVVALAIAFKISLAEWLVVCVLIALVISMEIINTAMENLCNLISRERNNTIKKIKDLSAAAVFISSIAAVVCGLIIFIPKICDFFI